MYLNREINYRLHPPQWRLLKSPNLCKQELLSFPLGVSLSLISLCHRWPPELDSPFPGCGRKRRVLHRPLPFRKTQEGAPHSQGIPMGALATTPKPIRRAGPRVSRRTSPTGIWPGLLLLNQPLDSLLCHFS